jgi:hypothetical protein
MQLSTTCRQSPHCDLAAVAWALLHACHGCGAVWMGRLDCGALAGLRCACCYHLAMGNTVPMWQCCASFMNEVCPRTPLLQLCGGLLTHTWLVTKNLQAFYSKWRFKAHPNVISDQVPCRAEQLYFPRISTQAATCSKRHTHDCASEGAACRCHVLHLPLDHIHNTGAMQQHMAVYLASSVPETYMHQCPAAACALCLSAQHRYQ